MLSTGMRLDCFTRFSPIGVAHDRSRSRNGKVRKVATDPERKVERSAQSSAARTQDLYSGLIPPINRRAIFGRLYRRPLRGLALRAQCGRGRPRSQGHSSSNIASASIVISTVLPTTMPPLSMVSFQLTPKSCRLIEVLATKPARVFGPLSTPSSHQGVCHSPR
jgi:hypothetical protein